VNVNFLALKLNARGVRLCEVRIIADDRQTMIDAVNALRATHDYVFTTGGIGPTHDDITSESIAAAFGLTLERNPQAVVLLDEYYGARINEARLRMANIPAGGHLLDNPVSRAPGFCVENVFVLPGVPRIMQAMFDGLAATLAGGRPVLSSTVSAFLGESMVASGLEAIQQRYPDVEIGSYPYSRNQRHGCALVSRCVDEQDLAVVTEETAALVRSLGGELEISTSQ
jgi:molybdopterin-biosynthesis enzyme MoeA-like protein